MCNNVDKTIYRVLKLLLRVLSVCWFALALCGCHIHSPRGSISKEDAIRIATTEIIQKKHISGVEVSAYPMSDDCWVVNLEDKRNIPGGHSTILISRTDGKIIGWYGGL
jgi:hypothetical protein